MSQDRQGQGRRRSKGGLARRLREKIGFALRRYRPRIILARSLRKFGRRGTIVAITGSSGKSTATALAGALLSTAMKTDVHVYFGMIGAISRAMIRFQRSKSDALVVEAGIFASGDMAVMGDMIRPDVAIVTLIGLEHVSSFRSKEAIAKEKGALVAAVPPTGIAVLNADDPLVRDMARLCRGRVVFHGRGEDAALRLLSAEYDWAEGLRLGLRWEGEDFEVTSRLVGTNWAPIVLGPLAAALALGIDKAACIDALQRFEPLFNRMSVHPTPRGRTFVLDAYKGAHWQVATTLAFLADIAAPRKTVILGTLSDRWGTTRIRYAEAARAALAVADRVIVTGPHASHVRRLLDRPGGERLAVIPAFGDVITRLAADIVPGEIVYLKATDRSRLERLMEAEFVTVRCVRETCDLPPICRRCALMTQGEAARDAAAF